MSRLLTVLIATTCLILSLNGAEWNQFHGDAPNTGFMPRSTSIADNPSWTLDVGPIKGSSPSFAPDGTIFVGNGLGTLIAVNTNGSVKWRREVRRGWSITTPAVDTGGFVYASLNLKAWVRDHRNGEASDQPRRFVQASRLHCLNAASGSTRWVYIPPALPLSNGESVSGFFTSQPKIWEQGYLTRIFILLSYWNTDTFLQENYLVVLDERGIEQEKVFLTEHAFFSVGGGGGLNFDFPSLDTSGAEIGPRPLPSGSHFPDTSVAIVDFPKYEEQPIVIASDESDTLSAFRWTPSGLSGLIWSKRIGGDQVEKEVYSAPAVFYNGNLAIGRTNGQVYLLNPETGEETNKPWPRLGAGIFSSASSFLRHMYVVTIDGEVVALDSDGEIWQTKHLGAQSVSSPAMSGSFIYVNAADGIHTLSFDLKHEGHFEFQGGGTSSPAIGKNGTVYTLGANTLFAFPR